MIPEHLDPAAPHRPGTAGKNDKPKKQPKPEYRFGIGEWFGRSFVHLSGDERRQYAAMQLLPKEQRPPQPCPFLSRPQKPVTCGKVGGVCSLRSYQRSPAGEVTVDARRSTLVTICPNRLEQDGTIYPWINQVVLPGQNALPVGETPFLRRTPKEGVIPRGAGRIDNILVVPQSDPLQWIPIEKQAVYFSGREMRLDFQVIAQSTGDAIPFPATRRRPDYRSSSAKRLLPQLETKVTTLRNWAKKTAVVVDEDFFAEFAPMDEVDDISNAHIVWFVVKYELEGNRFALKRSFHRMVTLENSIQAVMAARPIPQREFEQTLQTKLQARIGAAQQQPKEQP